MIRISSTLLEQYRLLIQKDFVSESDLIAQVRGEPFEPSWQMRAGTAWHTLLETPMDEIKCRFDQDDEGFCDSDGFEFHLDDVVNAKSHIGPGVWEVKMTKHYLSETNEPAEIVSKCDHLYGLVIQDNKAKFSQVDASAYDDSLQWRFYLLTFGAQCFRYNIFHFQEPDKDGYCHLKEIVSVKHWAYPGMAQDCLVWIRRFLEWAADRNLTKYLHRESHEKGRPTSKGM